jgi:hypothetical protein
MVGPIIWNVTEIEVIPEQVEFAYEEPRKRGFDKHCID